MCSGDTFIGKALGTASGKATAINQKIQDFSTTLTNEAKTVFGSADTVFNNMIGQVQQIFSGGPSQMGWSANEKAARDAAAVESGAVASRNLKGLVTSGPAIGAGGVRGGGVGQTGGLTNDQYIQAQADLAAKTAMQENQNISENFAQGNKNWQVAGQLESKLPGVYAESGANAMNETAAKEMDTAQKSQQAQDKQNNWAGGLVKSGLNMAADYATGGLSGIAEGVMSGIGNMSKDSSFGENVGNFWSGAINGKGSMPASGDSGGWA